MHCSLRPPDVAPFVPCFNDDAPLISLQIQQFRNRQLQHTPNFNKIRQSAAKLLMNQTNFPGPFFRHRGWAICGNFSEFTGPKDTKLGET